MALPTGGYIGREQVDLWGGREMGSQLANPRMSIPHLNAKYIIPPQKNAPATVKFRKCYSIKLAT